jgi:hypothetical protein
VTSDEPQPMIAAYAPALDRATRALALAAVVSEGVELGIGPHRVLSVVFLAVGLLVGFAIGRSLAKQLRSWAADAPVVTAADLARVRESKPSPLSVAALLLMTTIAVVVPIAWHLPTPLPGALTAAAIQALLQARVLHDIETARDGEVLRPVGQLAFEGSDLRLRANTN